MKERLSPTLCITCALIFLIGAALAFFLIAGDGGNVTLGTVIGAASMANLVFAILMYRRIGRRRGLVATVVLILLAAGLFGVIKLYRQNQVADIISDEAAWDLRDASPHKKVIITEGGMVARYLAEDEDNYIGGIQDTVWIPKSRAMVETWYACDGRGVVFLNEEGTKPAYEAPDSLSSVVGELLFERGYCPDSYDVVGYRDGWFAIDMSGNVGYVREEYVWWDAIDTN